MPLASCYNFLHRDMRFIKVRKANATQAWVALNGKQYLPGMIMVGGFHNEALTVDSPTTLFEVEFNTSDQSVNEQSFSVSNLSNDFVGASVNFASGNQNISAAPSQFKLHQNYPNPFHRDSPQGRTTIGYDIPNGISTNAINGSQQNTNVKITIYNIQGQVVRQLFSGAKESGKAHQTLWNGRNDAGLKVPTGIYYYRIKAGTLVQSRQLLVIK